MLETNDFEISKNFAVSFYVFSILRHPLAYCLNAIGKVRVISLLVGYLLLIYLIFKLFLGVGIDYNFWKIS